MSPVFTIAVVVVVAFWIKDNLREKNRPIDCYGEGIRNYLASSDGAPFAVGVATLRFWGEGLTKKLRVTLSRLYVAVMLPQSRERKVALTSTTFSSRVLPGGAPTPQGVHYLYRSG
ncbi:hypothetical protein AcV5_005201 [Taiwanofungus camphoratus]|nr:hypothetical protein AcV5_005201 [Antrodia cinnamomea]